MVSGEGGKHLIIFHGSAAARHIDFDKGLFVGPPCQPDTMKFG